MPSDMTRADALIAHLTDALKAALPNKWRIQDAEAGAFQSLGVVVYYEQGDLHTTVTNERLPAGFAGVDFMLTLTAPESDPTKGTRTVTAALLDLLPALDGIEDLYWGPTAEKVRLETGETTYRIPSTLITHYTKEG